MNGFLLAIMISGVISGTPGSIPLGLFSNADACVKTASVIIDSGILKDEHDVWCIPVKITDGYANNNGELQLQ